MQIIAKVFATVLALLVFSRSYLDWKSKKEAPIMAVFWIGVWMAILVISYFPSIIDKLIGVLGGERTGLGTVFGMGLALVLFINYRVYAKAHRIEKALEQISREIAISSLGVKPVPKKRRSRQ